MKRLYCTLFACTLLSVTHLSAQTDNSHDEDDADAKRVAPAFRVPTSVGNSMVGANLLFARAQFQKGLETNYSVGITPKLAFFALPNFALGMAVDLGVEGQKGYRAISYGLTPFARIYFAHDNTARARPLQFFVEGGAGFGGVNTRTETGSGVTDLSTNGFRAYVFPGIDYFLNQNVALESGLQYTFNSGNPDAHLLSLNLGLQIFLTR